MHWKDYGSGMCVCVMVQRVVCVSMLPRNLLPIPRLFIENKVMVLELFVMFVVWLLLKRLRSSQSSGFICWSQPPSMLPNNLSMDKRDSNNFFLARSMDVQQSRSQNTTGSSLTYNVLLLMHSEFSVIAERFLMLQPGILL